ncbi:MAG: VWA domain-containing protein [Sedimenticola sp.]|nr:MAG: VWA domain-containing protein [Sedimenticola sp.]
MTEWSFHFAQPWWLLALLLILPVAMWLRRSHAHGRAARLKLYADPHLLPHLTGSRELKSRERWQHFSRWVALWVLLTLAMAGPRWDAMQIRLFSPGANLVVLLDISRSMEVTDVRPSRIARARQEVEDLLSQNRGIAIGLIAFASIAHVMSPITEDSDAILSRLPAISTSLVQLQGSRLADALEKAKLLLAGQPEENSRNILIISDGDFADQGLLEQARKLASEDIRIHVLGIGTPGGGPVPGVMGRFLTNAQGETVESPLDEAGLQALAQAGGGIYLSADFRDEDTQTIIRSITAQADAKAMEQETTQVWNERFYWLVIAAMLLLVPFFRRSRHLPKGKAG